jgi:hypothetical protein
LEINKEKTKQNKEEFFMNMKKTIAAVAACAVAVSAMATTVSAEEGTLHYNLVNTTYKTNAGTVKYRATISADAGVKAAAGNGALVINFDASKTSNITSSTLGGNISWTVTGYTMDSQNTKTDTFSYVNYVPSVFTWQANSSSLVKYGWGTDTQFVIPLNTAGISNADTLYATIEITVGHKDTSWGYSDLSKAELSYGYAASASAATAADATTALISAASDFTSASTTVDAQYPLYTTANTTSYGTSYATGGLNGANYVSVYGTDGNGNKTNINGAFSNILTYLSDNTWNLVSEGQSYVNVIPVINDVLTNYDDVTFVFNTASSGVKAVTVELDGTNDGAGNKIKQIVGYKYSSDSDADTQYTSFGQHLYNWYGDETTGNIYSTAYDFNGYNLFSGALVVNGSLSMQLSDTNVFDYGSTTLSFNWEDVTSNGNVNSYVTYLQKLQLATSTTWYWDSLDVTYADTEADDIGAGEGAEADEDEIDEDEDEDVVADEDEDVDVDEDEDVDVEEEEEEDVDVEEEEEAPAAAEEVATSNPSTGNAPIALAVIPVALAAAAVVAKKRG